MTSPLSSLLVPINVEALCVNAKTQDGTLLPSLTNFDKLPYNKSTAQREPFLSEVVMSQPFASGSLESGVHLHWAMPDRLMHGEQQDEASAQTPMSGSVPRPFRFPSLPDRWLVTRTEAGNPETSVSWVVDSRFVAEKLSAEAGNDRSPSVPWENPQDTAFKQQPFRYVGRKLPLDRWSAPAADLLLPELTAASLGLVQASAYYPSCRNVFGMHHPPPNPTAATEYAYTVIGWHADLADDPLYGKDAATTAATLTRLNWKAPVVQQPDGQTFARTVYLGHVHSVRWDSELSPVAPGPMTAVFGNTNAEASSALHAASARNTSPTFRNEMQALITAQLNLLTESGGDTRVARQFHRQRFSPVTFGNLWYVGLATDGSDAYSTLADAHLKVLLETLNEREQKRMTARDKAAALQWQLFADWYKYLKCRYPGQEKLPNADNVRKFMEKNSLDLAQKAVAACEAATDEVTETHKELAGKLGPAHQLFAKPLPSSWRPVDPMLLLQGVDVKPAMRFGGEGELPCRIAGPNTAEGFISALNLREGNVPGVGSVLLDATTDQPHLERDIDKIGLPIALLQCAILEGRLFWPAWAGAKLAARAGRQDSAPAVQQWLMQQDFAAGASPWQGQPPARNSITAWSTNPWLPIMMHWSITYQPLAIIQEEKPDDHFEPGLVMNRIADSLDDDEVDLVLRAPSQEHLTDNLPRSYQGITFITPQAGQQVKQQLKVYGEQHPASSLAELEPALKDIPLLSQSLSGFHDRLLLRRQTLQVDIRDPFAQTSFEKNFAMAVKSAVTRLDTRVTTMAPIVQDAFNPIRGGNFWLKSLWLADVFGQCRQFEFQKGTENRVLASPSLTGGDGETQPMFPPRLSQAMRVNFRWVASNGDEDLTGVDPQASPICGWVVPNFLDRSVAIYDGAGDALGSIMAVGGRLLWQASPTHPEAFQRTPEELFEGRNPHLRDYTLSLLRRQPEPVKFLDAYLDTLHAASMLTQPQESAQHASLPMLMGQPLALTRASLKLSLAGLPAVNQTWSAFQRDTGVRFAESGEGNAVVRTTNRHEDVQYPVVLGMGGDPDDGLAGFYLGDDNGTQRFAEFFAVAAAGEDTPGIHTRKIHTLHLSPETPRLVFSLLVDPRAQVVITTGYTPAQTQMLPPEAVKRAFAKMAVTFLCAPLLTTEAPPERPEDKVRLPLPLPGQQKGSWSWVRVALDGTGRQSAIVADTEAAPPDQAFSNGPLNLQEGWLSLSVVDKEK